MTETQKTLITELIVAELARLRADALAAGASPADVDAELARRIEVIKNTAR